MDDGLGAEGGGTAAARQSPGKPVSRAVRSGKALEVATKKCDPMQWWFAGAEQTQFTNRWEFSEKLDFRKPSRAESANVSGNF